MGDGRVECFVGYLILGGEQGDGTELMIMMMIMKGA